MTDVEPWAWVVLVAAYFAIFLNGSFYYSIGVIHIALLDKYQNVDVTTVAWVGSLYSSTMLVTGVLGSVIVNIFNVRTCIILSAILNIVGFTLSFLVDDVRLLMVTFSVIAGCGQAICYTGSMIVIGYYFKEKTSMATGIVTSASGLSLFVFPPLTQYFIDEFGLNGTFLLLGAIGFEVAISGAVMRPTKYETRSRRGRCYKHRSENPQNKELNQDEKKPLYTSLPFWILLLSSMCFGVALSIIYLYLPEYNKQHGSTPQEAAIIMSIVGITGLLSRILLGFLASAVDAAIIYNGIFGIMGIINVMINLMVTFPTKLAYAALFGMYTGGCWSLQHTLVVEMVGLPNLSTAYGITMSFTGIGYLIGPPLAGLIVSTFKVLYYAFLFASLFFFLSSFTMLLMRLLTKQLPQTKVTQVSDVLITEHEDLYACSQEYDDETTRRGDNIIASSGEFTLLTAR